MFKENLFLLSDITLQKGRQTKVKKPQKNQM